MIFRWNFCSLYNEKPILENIVFHFGRKHLFVYTFLWDSVKIHRNASSITTKSRRILGSLKSTNFRSFSAWLRSISALSWWCWNALSICALNRASANGPANRIAKTIFRIDCLLYRSRIDEFPFRWLFISPVTFRYFSFHDDFVVCYTG